MTPRKRAPSPLRNFITESKSKLDAEIEQRREKVREKYRYWEPFFIGSFTLHFCAAAFIAIFPRWLIPQHLGSVLFYATLASLYFLASWAFRRLPAGTERKRSYWFALCCLISLIVPGYAGSAFRSSQLADSVEITGKISGSEAYTYRLRYGREHTGYRVFAKFKMGSKEISGFCGGCPMQTDGMPVVLKVSKSYPRIFEGNTEKTLALWKKNKETEDE